MKNCFKALAFAFLCIFSVNTAFAQCTASLFAGGNGTEGNPYQISTAEQLQNLNKCLGSRYQYNHYVLNNDINLTSYLQGAGNNGGAGWEPIGKFDNYNSFRGRFNGNGYKVSGLWINRPIEHHVGLFGCFEPEAIKLEGDIRNIGVEIDNVKGGVIGNGAVGGLVGSYSLGTISNSYAIGNVSGNGDVGGLVGENSGGTISNSYAIGSVSGNEGGGLVGKGCTISNSYATGNVSGGYHVGGLVGAVGEPRLGCTISSSYAAGNVSGDRDVGGLVGYNDGGTISNSYATGSVSGSISVGGLVGSAGGTISNCYATGNVSGDDGVGGLVGNGGAISNSYATGNVSISGYVVGGSVGGLAGGLVDNGGTISNSYATGNVTGMGNSMVGGLVGYNHRGTVSNSYAMGNVTGMGSGPVGGLVGYNGGTVSNSYATGNITGNGGGLVEINYGTVSGSYYDKETTGRTIGNGIGKTTAEMKTKSTYEGWDFENTWAMLNNSYPVLKWQLIGKTVLVGAVVSSIQSQPYTGSAIKPDFTVKLGETVLIKNTDYIVLYSNSRDAGTAKITIIGKGNYIGSTEGNFTITTKPVTITALVNNKVYDGNTTATIATTTINGKIEGDAVTVSNGTASFENASVGTGKTVTFSGFSLSGTDANNYTLSAQPASVTANITAQPTPTPPPPSIVEVDKCGTSTINYDKQFCYNDKVYSLCGGSSYDPDTEKCQSGAVVSKTTPILPQSASVGNILVHTTTNAILLSNLPSNAKVEVYNIQGKLVFTSGKSSNRENRGSDNLKIGVQTNGMYIVKVGTRTMRVAVR